MYIRFQSTTPNQRGTYTGVFGLVNGLSKAGRLTPEQESFRRTSNDWYDANFTNPTDVDATVYDPAVNPGAAAWFKETSTRLVERVDGYLEILARHGIACEPVRSADPGQVVYEDIDQIVVIPRPGVG